MKTTDTEYIKKNLLRSDLSPTQQLFFDFLGTDKYVDFCEVFGGLNSVSIAQLDTLKRAIARRKINENIDLYTSGVISVIQVAQMYKTTDIKKNLLRSDLTPTQQLFFDFLGIDKYIDFCEVFGGISSVPIAQLDTLKRAIARRKINENIDLYTSGAISVRQIAQMYNINERTTYNILAGR